MMSMEEQIEAARSMKTAEDFQALLDDMNMGHDPLGWDEIQSVFKKHWSLEFHSETDTLDYDGRTGRYLRHTDYTWQLFGPNGLVAKGTYEDEDYTWPAEVQAILCLAGEPLIQEALIEIISWDR